MRSLWTVTYVGAHTATTVKKLERLLGIRACDIERERCVWEQERIERAAFFVEHGALEWSALLVLLLQKTSILATHWQTRGNATDVLSAEISPRGMGRTFLDGALSGLREVAWTVRADQKFPAALLSVGSKIARW